MDKEIKVGYRVAFKRSFNHYAGRSYFQGFCRGQVLNVQDNKVVVWYAQRPEVYNKDEVLRVMQQFEEYQEKGTINGENPDTQF